MNSDPKLPVTDQIKQQDLPAGCFSSWLRRLRLVLLKENGVNVCCGECNACCKSSYFIHIGPEETQTLSRIPKRLLFAAPGLPKGNVLLGYDKDGHCPMLINGRCSIYDYRPITCRNYDCRIFAATGINAGSDDKELINQQIRRWKFHYPTKRDYDLHSAVQAATRFLQDRAECFPSGVPDSASQLAILALKVYSVFLNDNDNNESGDTGLISPDIEIARAIIEANGKFETRYDALKAKSNH